MLKRRQLKEGEYQLLLEIVEKRKPELMKLCTPFMGSEIADLEFLDSLMDALLDEFCAELDVDSEPSCRGCKIDDLMGYFALCYEDFQDDHED